MLQLVATFVNSICILMYQYQISIGHFLLNKRRY